MQIVQINNYRHVPELERISGSWIITRIDGGYVIGEFYDRSVANRFILKLV